MAVWDTLLPYAPLVTPAAVLLGAVAAYVGVDRTVRQKAAADRRAQVWARMEWAVDQTLRPDRARQSLGIAALLALLDQDRLDAADAEVVEFALRVVLRVRDEAQQATVGGPVSAQSTPGPGEVTPEELYEQARRAAERLQERLRRAREPPRRAGRGRDRRPDG